METAYKTGKQEPKIIVAKLKNFEHKIEILKNKSKLKGKNIYIDSDLTLDEQKTQAEIRKAAKEEKDKGNNTKVGYRKLEINGMKYVWNDEEGKLKKITITNYNPKN